MGVETIWGETGCEGEVTEGGGGYDCGWRGGRGVRRECGAVRAVEEEEGGIGGGRWETSG